MVESRSSGLMPKFIPGTSGTRQHICYHIAISERGKRTKAHKRGTSTMTLRQALLVVVVALPFIVGASTTRMTNAFVPLNQRKPTALGETLRGGGGAGMSSSSVPKAASQKSCTQLASSSSTGSVISSDTLAIHDEEEDERMLAEELEACKGFIIDPHLHIANWFQDDPDALVEELRLNSVSQGLLYNPYVKFPMPFDMNTYVHSIASASGGRVYMLASLNTTHDDWESHRENEMERLRSFLEKPEVLGCKLAPPHTCLSMSNRRLMDDILSVVASSNKKVLATHIGTTPFCGPLGRDIGLECRCGPDYVDPTLLERYIVSHPDVKFVLLHAGHEFLPEGDPNHYKFSMVDKCIDLAKRYPNVYLSVSALFAQTPEGGFKYPGGTSVTGKIKRAGVAHKTFWGSDAAGNRNQIKPVLCSAIRAMRAEGWSPQERTAALGSLAKEIFQIPDPE